MNFIFTEKLLREHFSEDIVSELVPKEDIPSLSATDSQYLTSMIQLAKAKGGWKFERLVRCHSFEDPLARLFSFWSFNMCMWQYTVENDREGYKNMNKRTYQSRYVEPIMDAFFGNLMMFQVW
jgi:hypothetical protein